ncbi:DNA-binding protein RFX7 isoform X2 [Nasonia vitripennis]|uniref:RFX-type winged-helix domain-containing protein n=1 Tax=Nasonia vitripennis TaxID=7425 RepID=A0A7M7PXC1_NASVI|nr:DNA-binding protein RFX7 isoform X2 [Nasonia vitripennis]
MSAQSQGCSTPIKLEPAAARVKKEQLEMLADAQATTDARLHLQQQPRLTGVNCITPSAQSVLPSPSPSPSLANGYPTTDLLHDILRASKLNSLAHHTPAAKNEKIRLMIEDSISEESRSRVHDIFSQVEQLKLEEKLLLYLKLPISLTNPNGTVDPLRQPLNPLGNRYEIYQTIMWIKTHLEEDPEVSLPKQEVYDEYNIFCSKNSMKPLSTADFGKVMKQVYPRVRPRRLGTRGNSRYCYAGMRKRIKLDPPTLPSATATEVGEDAEHNVTEEMLGAASTIIREWAEFLLETKFPTLCALGKYLVNNLYVDSRSLAAVCILSASGEAQPVTKKDESPGLPATPTLVKMGKLREAQLQLQRKLQQREQVRDLKHRHLENVLQSQNNEKTVDQNNEGVGSGNKKGKKGKANVNHLAQGTNASSKINATAVVSAGRQKKVLKSNNQSCSISLQSNCDNLVVQSIQDEQNSSTSRLVTSDSAISPREIKTKYTRKRASSSVALQASSESSPEKQLKLVEAQQNALESVTRSSTPGSRLSSASNQQSAKISVILANNPKAAKSNKTTGEAAVAPLVNQPIKSCDKELSLCSNNYSKSNGYSNGSDLPRKTNLLTENEIRLLQENSSLASVKGKLGSIDSDALNDYLNGGNNSQEPEEELMLYFQQSNSSSSDMELSGVVAETELASRQDKVSQLRIILQENLKDSVLPAKKDSLQSVVANEKQQTLQKHNLILPTLLNKNNNVNTRRRVSFETNTVEQSQDNGGNASALNSNTVPQSPNTRRRIFNFTPISPGPQSPINGRASKSNSANASPFVSPRNTPVPRSRSNLQGSCRSRGSQKILSRSISCNVPFTSNKNETFIVPTTGSEINRHVHSPLAVNNKASQASQLGLQSLQQDPVPKSQNLPCAPFLTDLASQEPQLLINYPSQENLQEIKNVYQQQKHQPTDQEISDLLQSESEKQQFVKDQLFRSQSVPLHRMVNPALLSPISSHHTPTFLSHSFNPSTNSSIAPTPVPSEFNDFGSISQCDSTSYLIEVDPLVTAGQPFLMEDKEMIPDNLNNIFDMLNQDSEILTESSTDKERTETSDPILMNSLSSLNDRALLESSSSELLANWTNGNTAGNNNSNSNNTWVNSASNNAPKILHSRSYPNTPLPIPNSSFTVQYPEDSNGSKSYPTTPLHNLQQQETWTESNEPMLFSPTLNTLSLHSQTGNIGNVCPTNVECNVGDFLEPDMTNDDTDDLGSLGNFEGLQDVGALSPLFTEVVESNH